MCWFPFLVLCPHATPQVGAEWEERSVAADGTKARGVQGKHAQGDPPPLRPLPPGPCLPARAAGVVLDFLARSRGRAVPSRSFASCKRVLDNIRERRGLVF